MKDNIINEQVINGKKLILIEVLTRKEKKQFKNLPFKIYKNYSLWVPIMNILYKDFMDLKTNPQFKNGEGKITLVYKDGVPVARAIIGVNYFSNEKLKEDRALFTLFECIEDYDVFKFMMDSFIEYAKEKNQEHIWGPLSPDFSDNFRGTLVEGFEESPFFMQSYNPPYYVDYFEKYGFTSYEDMVVLKFNLTQEPEERLIKIFEYTKKKLKIRIEIADPKHKLYEQARILADVNQDAYDELFMEQFPGFVAPTYEDFLEITKTMKQFVQNELILIVYCDEKPAGIAIAFPDYNDIIRSIKGRVIPFGWIKMILGKKHIKRARGYDIAVAKGFQGKGINAILAYELFKNGRKLGYESGESGTTHVKNVKILNTLESIGGKVYKKYKHYGLKFS